jgi:hypothetical protein
MLLRLRTSHFRFVYTFNSGHELVGIVEGDYFANAPDVVFNLRSLKAICLDPHGTLAMSFDTVFGQFTRTGAEVIFSGSQGEQGSLFSFNYRDAEASIYDSTTDTWIAAGWNPGNWHIEELVTVKSKPVVAMPLWASLVSA